MSNIEFPTSKSMISESEDKKQSPEELKWSEEIPYNQLCFWATSPKVSTKGADPGSHSLCCACECGQFLPSLQQEK